MCLKAIFSPSLSLMKDFVNDLFLTFFFIFLGGKNDRVCGVFDRACYSKIERDSDAFFECQCLDNCEKIRYDPSWLLKEKRFIVFLVFVKQK